MPIIAVQADEVQISKLKWTRHVEDEVLQLQASRSPWYLICVQRVSIPMFACQKGYSSNPSTFSDRPRNFDKASLNKKIESVEISYWEPDVSDGDCRMAGRQGSG